MINVFLANQMYKDALANFEENGEGMSVAVVKFM